MIDRYTASVVQAAPVFLDLSGTVAKGVGLIEEAASKGARIIGFPEVWIPGYPWWIWLDHPLDGLRFVQAYHENSLPLDSPQLQVLCDAAKENNIFVVMGASERYHGSLYLAQIFIDNNGYLLGSRRN